MPEHTPLPMSYSEPGEHSMDYELWGSDGENIGSILPWADHGVDNVKLVVNACNSHEELLAAAKHMREVQKQADWGNRATEEIWREAEEELETAIKKAEEGKS